MKVYSVCTNKYFLWHDCLVEQWPTSKHSWFRGRSDTNKNMMSGLQLYSKPCLFRKKIIFGIILPTLNNEWAEILVRHIISWLASYTSDFFFPQQSKKIYYNKIIIKILSLEISRSPWFMLVNQPVSLPQFCRSQPNTFPTWPCFPQWSSQFCLPCSSCGTSGWEDLFSPRIPNSTARLWIWMVHREYDLALYISCCEILTYSD